MDGVKGSNPVALSAGELISGGLFQDSQFGVSLEVVVWRGCKMLVVSFNSAGCSMASQSLGQCSLCLSYVLVLGGALGAFQ